MFVSSVGRSSAPENPEIDVSLITVTFNSAKTLERFWSTAALPAGTEWIVVDNASTDDSVAVAERLGARVIRLRDNLGFGRANNIGFQLSRGEFVGFVNPDIEIASKDFGSLKEAASRTGGIVAPQLLHADGSLQANGRGYPFLHAKVRNRLAGDDPAYLLFPTSDDPHPVVWVMGAALFAQRNVFTAIGPWDPRFFIYYEDADISIRAWSQGYPTSVVPQVRWTHGWARETSGFRFQPWRREIQSMVTFYTRYPEFLGTRATAARRHCSIDEAVFGVSR